MSEKIIDNKTKFKKPKKLRIGKIDVQISSYEETSKDGRLIIKCRGLMKDFEKYSPMFLKQRSKLSAVRRSGVDKSDLIMIAELIHWRESEQYGLTYV